MSTHVICMSLLFILCIILNLVTSNYIIHHHNKLQYKEMTTELTQHHSLKILNLRKVVSHFIAEMLDYIIASTASAPVRVQAFMALTCLFEMWVKVCEKPCLFNSFDCMFWIQCVCEKVSLTPQMAQFPALCVCVCACQTRQIVSGRLG